MYTAYIGAHIVYCVKRNFWFGTWLVVITEAYCNRAVCCLLSVCLLQPFLVARWKLLKLAIHAEDVCSNLHWQNFCSKVSSWMAWFAYLDSRWRSGLLWRQNCPHVTWQLVGSICTTDTGEIAPKSLMAKPTAISLACWYCCHAQLINSCLLLCLHKCLHSLGGWLSNSLCIVRAFINLCMPASWYFPEASAPVVLFFIYCKTRDYYINTLLCAYVLYTTSLI